jgi:hypothetical protein
MVLGTLFLAAQLVSSTGRAQTTTSEVPPPPMVVVQDAPPQAPPPQTQPPQTQPPQAPPPQAPPPQAQPAPQVAPATGYAPAPTASPYVAQPQVAQPAYGAYGVQPTSAYTPPVRRGDRLEDTAQTGEIIDLMITTGGYGIMVGNGIVFWSDNSGTPSHTTATILGATLSLTGLLAIDAPRGVPTTMAVGLRYGLALSLLGYGAFAGNAFDGEAALAAMALGGLIGYGVGAGIGFGGRPHTSRTRFVETGGLWGTGLGAILAAAACERCDGGGVFGALLAGASGGVLAHTLVAFLAPVSAARGWLLNAAFVGGAGLGALLPWGLTNGNGDGHVIAAISAATGVVALGVVFAVSDGIQDSGWEESAEETLSHLQIGVGPTQGGAMATVGGAF